MKRSDFSYPLPPELIAQQPMPERSASRMLYLPVTGVQDRYFQDLLDILQAGDLLVCNDTQVIPARLYALKETGGKVEILIERIIGSHQVRAQVRASKSPKVGSRLVLEDGLFIAVVARDGMWFDLEFPLSVELMDVLDQQGHIPLPPYINRADTLNDRDRYQTVFAKRPGAVAAPTAGLHFDQAMFDRLQEKGVDRGFVTLHVGAGTYQPVRVDDLSDHRMHAEHVEVSDELCAQIKATQQRGGRIVAVGTTVMRSLETAAAMGELAPYRGESRLFITPGYSFKVVDVLLTNFHLSESTLLMLVCAFAGYDTVMQAYQHAITQKYRFFSYGDAMLLEHNMADQGSK
ncbi:MAG: tRNA preQ1(34) S-adenosylmethionine ribosyltransferase-isomerase QueA [Gammaproteobacteria bacterium]|nr:tRNA preQ1(34) S-adenosylmethionine ribosyltransferase-isomerase QueA [Gammaproteobacteria bacterium]